MFNNNIINNINEKIPMNSNYINIWKKILDISNYNISNIERLFNNKDNEIELNNINNYNEQEINIEEEKIIISSLENDIKEIEIEIENIQKKIEKIELVIKYLNKQIDHSYQNKDKNRIIKTNYAFNIRLNHLNYQFSNIIEKESYLKIKLKNKKLLINKYYNNSNYINQFLTPNIKLISKDSVENNLEAWKMVSKDIKLIIEKINNPNPSI